MAFTLAGAVAGARQSVPLALGSAAYGVVFGALARQTGLAPAEALAMSGLVVAGAAQFVALEVWTTPVPVAALLLTTLIVNARHLVMGAALRPWFGRLPARQAYPALFFLSDESWALTHRALASGGRDGAVLLGSGLLLSVGWLAGTATGLAAGARIGDPARWGLDFAATAVFAALLTAGWDGPRRLLPWAVAGGVAVLAERWLPGSWYVLLGGVAGGLAGAVADGD